MNLRGVQSLTDRVEELEDHDQSHDKRITDLEKDLKELNDKVLLGGGGGDGVDGNALASLLDSLRKECDEKYAPRDGYEDLKARVE